MGQARKKSVEKVKETPEKKAQKELAPDFVDDQEIKDQEYEDPVLMKMIAGEEPEKMEFSETVKSALKPYNGNLQQKIEELVKAYNSAQAQLSALNNVQNVIKEISFDELNPHELIASMNKLKTAAFDFMNNPLALDALN